MNRHILSLLLALLITAQATPAVVEPVSFTNLKTSYVDLQIDPVLVNDGSAPIYLRTSDGGVMVDLFYFNKAKREWERWPAFGRCGNEQPGFKTVSPGQKEHLSLDWGIQSQVFDITPPPRTLFKVSIRYTLEPPDSAGDTRSYLVESTPFLMQYRRRRK